MQSLLQNLRFALRSLLKAPGFSCIVIISIALAFAANATVFSVANGLLWGVLPVKDSQAMVMFSEGRSFSYPDYIDYNAQSSEIFEGGVLAHFPLIPASMGGSGTPERIWGQTVSGNYFPALQIAMTMGRPILPEDDRTLGSEHVVVLSNALWKRRFNGNTGIVNQQVMLNGHSYTVVGVAPPGFYGLDRGIISQFWVPLNMTEEMMPDLTDMAGGRNNRSSNWLMLNARLRPGVSRARAAVLVNVIKKRLDDTYRKDQKDHEGLTLQSAGALIAGSITPAYALMGVLMSVVGLVLLVACANVANLLLARATGRQKEIAIRLAMGVGRRRLVQQLMIECLLLALAGAAIGFALAAVAARAISNFKLPLPFPIVFDFNVDLRVAAFTLGLSVITALLFGLVPALRASNPDLVSSLKDSSPALGREGRSRLRNSLVVVQVALSLVLLATAGLFLRSLGNASSIDIGFKPDKILLMSVDPKLHNYSNEKTSEFLKQLRDKTEALPGVRSVSYMSVVPLSIGTADYDFEILATKDHAAKKSNANVNSVGARYFETMSIPLLRGRDFNAQVDNEHTAIINEAMAADLFAGQDPIGQTFTDEKKAKFTVIGVVRNSKLRTIGEQAVNCVYFFLNAAPQRAISFFGITVLVKTHGDPEHASKTLREQIAALDPNMAIFNSETMNDHLDKALLLPRVSALLLGIFGSVGLTLASIGLYGLMSYSVRRRTREIGIRIALGAKPPAVVRMVFRQGLLLTAIGLAIGLGISLAIGRFTASLLYGTRGSDPLTFLVVSLVLLATSVIAILVPAVRAAHVQPTVALRCE
ncbi:MAG: ABC transporter permease [Acidobacteria bacterium]|nr:ABC transporter permease [Acidobacteriota bacterium]